MKLQTHDEEVIQYNPYHLISLSIHLSPEAGIYYPGDPKLPVIGSIAAFSFLRICNANLLLADRS